MKICSHHKKLFVDKYEFLHNCRDPFLEHTKSVKSSLSTLDIPKSERINSLTTGINIKPGQKICSQSMARLSTIDGCCVSSDDQIDNELVDDISALNTSATAPGCSLIKFSKVSQRDVILC